MTAPKQRRWYCPRCEHGVHAPGRMRTDDVRRYCLPCSTETGRLVVRTCPALDRERAARAERSAAKRTATTAAQRATARRRRERVAARADAAAERARADAIAKRTVGGLDLDVEADRLWKLDALRAERRWRTERPVIEWRRSKTKRHTSGRCFYGERIVVTIGLDGADAASVVLHELVHAAIGYDYVGRSHHGPRFARVFRRGATEAWPHVDFAWHTTPDVGGHTLMAHTVAALGGRRAR